MLSDTTISHRSILATILRHGAILPTIFRRGTIFSTRLVTLSLTALFVWAQIASAQQTKLTAPVPAERDQYGMSVAVAGGIAVVGANLDDEAGSNKGAIYVYAIHSGGVTEEAKLLPVRPGQYNNSHFGTLLDTDGTRIVDGIHEAFPPGRTFPPVGAVAVYARQNGVWAEEAYIVNPAEGASFYEFGHGVAIDGDLLVIGDPGDDKDARNSGRAYIYRWDGSAWIQEAVLSPPTAVTSQRFGEAVDVDGDRVIIGAPGHFNIPIGGGGTGVYVYAPAGDGTWAMEANITQSTTVEADRFGSSIAVSGDRVLVRAGSAGVAYVFLRADDGTWSEEDVLTGISGNTSGWGPVAMADDKIVVSATRGDGAEAESGVAYVYNRSADGWGDPVQIQADDGGQGDSFGSGVATDGQYVLVGAVTKSVDALPNAGAAYLFTPSATPTEQQPTRSALRIEAPFPNPFRSATQIAVTLERPDLVEVEVCDVLSRRVARLHRGTLPSGTHRVQFDARDLPSGVYFIRVATPDLLATRTVTLLP